MIKKRKRPMKKDAPRPKEKKKRKRAQNKGSSSLHATEVKKKREKKSNIKLKERLCECQSTYHIAYVILDSVKLSQQNLALNTKRVGILIQCEAPVVL